MKKIIATMFAAATAAVIGGCAGTTEPQEIALAKDGATNYTIVYKFTGDLLLDPAVRDLAATLKAITGAEFPIADQADGPKIFIGK